MSTPPHSSAPPADRPGDRPIESVDFDRPDAIGAGGPAPVSTWVLLGLLVVVAAALRLAYLGRTSLGYDEVVQMLMARQPTVAGLFRVFFEIEATRAPLHPLALQGWLRLFGPSDVSGRMLSVVCGIATVPVVHRIARRLYDAPTALWAAYLAAISPILVQYSQETKMYAWLTLATCLAWW